LLSVAGAQVVVPPMLMWRVPVPVPPPRSVCARASGAAASDMSAASTAALNVEARKPCAPLPATAEPLRLPRAFVVSAVATQAPRASFHMLRCDLFICFGLIFQRNGRLQI
jgi:hypothetical protein